MHKGGNQRPTAASLLLLLWVIVLSGCTPTAFLKPNENLLYKVRLKGIDKADPATIQSLYQQQPVSTLPLVGGAPKLWFWIQGRKIFKPEKTEQKLARIDQRFDDKIRKAAADSFKVVDLFERRERRRKDLALRKDKGNFMMRKLGEPPVVYDSLKTLRAVDQINIYLNGKGFFRGRVVATTKLVKHKVFVTYTITEGPDALVASLRDSIADPALAAIVQADRDSIRKLKGDPRLLREGNRYDSDLLGLERTRLEALLKNHGYYQFKQLYISFVVDTTKLQQIRLTTIIDNPPGAKHHTLYRLREVSVIADADRNRFGVTRQSIEYRGVNYLAYERTIQNWALDRKVSLRPGQPFSPVLANRTQRQLTDLDLFRFVNVRFRQAPTPADSAHLDSLNGGIPVRYLDASVLLNPQRRFQETTELGVTVAALLPGPFGSERLRIRNLIKSGELLDITLRGALEGQFPFVQQQGNAQKGILTTQLGANLSLSFPRILLTTPKFDRRMAAYSPRTRLTASYSFVNRDEYTRGNSELTYDYVWQRSPQLQYTFAPIDISFINTIRTSAAFDSTLDVYQSRGFPLKRSFQTQVVPSFSFQRIFNSNDFAQTKDALYTRLGIEVGGLTNLLFGYDKKLSDIASREIPVFSFVKVALDVRRYWKIGTNQFLVARFNGGVARSLQKNSNGDVALFTFSGLGALPYDKYFFAGGPSSLRAWRPRRLGPGAYHQPDLVINDRTVRDPLEQPGEVLIETNLEYRAPIFSYLKGAIFVDAGNIWTLTQDLRQGARFELNKFYQQFAIGAGVGFRFDFSFLVLRLDVAARVIDPTVPATESRYVLPKLPTAYNLGIGYPF